MQTNIKDKYGNYIKDKSIIEFNTPTSDDLKHLSFNIVKVRYSTVHLAWIVTNNNFVMYLNPFLNHIKFNEMKVINKGKKNVRE